MKDRSEKLDLGLNDRVVEAMQELGTLAPLFDVLATLEASPTGKDPRIKAFAQAAMQLLLTNAKFRHSLLFMQDFRAERGRPTSPLYAANLTLRVAQHHLRFRPDYAELSASKEGWCAGIEAILNDSELHDSFDNFLALHEVQTNVPARYMGPKLVLSLYRNNFKGPISLLDVGPSIGNGVKALVSNGINHDVKVWLPSKGEAPDSGKLISQDSVTEHIKGKLAEPLNFGYTVGVDAMGVFDDADREWVKSNHYPSEVVENRGGMMSEFDRWSNQNVPNYRTVSPLDFSHKASVDQFMADSPVEKFDVVTMLTVINQMTEQEAAVAIANARRIARFVIIGDFAKVNKNTLSGLEFFPFWHPYTYRTIVADTQSPADGFEELFWWRNGRCEDVIIAPSANFFSSHQSAED